MNKLILWIILFTFVIDMCVNANSFLYDQVYHTETKTWGAASDVCGSDGLESDENVLMNIDVLSDTKFWIGVAIYSVTTPWIEVLGCCELPNGQKVTKSPSIVLCQKQCESYQFFGYSEFTETCFCQHNKSRFSNISDCIVPHASTFFVYKVYSGYVSGNVDEKCTTLYCNPRGNGLQSAKCNDTTDVTRASRCNDGYTVGWYKPYLTSKQLCIKRSHLLLQPETYCQSRPLEGITYWTNVFRDETEAKLTKAEAGTKEPLYCLAGSLMVEYGKRKLIITRRFCNELLHFVCIIGNATATTQSQSTLVTRTLQKDARTSFDIGALIGGILGACLMISVLVVLIVCKVRSKGIFKESNTQDYEDTSRVNFSTTYEDLGNTKHKNLTATTNQACDIDESSAPVYEEVNKIEKPGNSILK